MMCVDERGPRIAGPTGQARVGGWERKVDGWMMSRLRFELGSAQVEGCQCCCAVGGVS